MDWQGRSIVHLDLDTFFVSVERLINNKLVGKPVIIGGGSDRGVVSSCSYEARQYGIHSAMPMRMARQLCSNGFFIRGDGDLYTKYSHLVTDIIAEKTPLFEKASIDEFYIDITGMDRFFGCQKWTHELRQSIIKNSGLPISFGLSINKTVAKIGTGEAKPNGELFIPTPQVKPFLHPLPINKIPMLGPKSFHLLRSMGVDTIGTLSLIPKEMMISVLGKNGINIWNKANGIDFNKVKPYSEKKSIGTERTFEQDSIDVVRMNEILVTMVEKLCFELRKKQRLTSCVTVKIRYSNFDTHTLQKRIAYTSFDHQLIGVTKDLFARLYKRRMLIRLIGVRFSHLIQGSQQLNIFEDTPTQVKLYQTMDMLRKRYGNDLIKRAIGLKQ